MKHVHPVSIPLMAFLARVKGLVDEPKTDPPVVIHKGRTVGFSAQPVEVS